MNRYVYMKKMVGSVFVCAVLALVLRGGVHADDDGLRADNGTSQTPSDEEIRKHRRRQYMNMVELRRRSIERTAESFQRSQVLIGEISATSAISDAGKGDDNLSGKYQIHPALRIRGVAESAKAPSVVEFFKHYELRSSPLRILRNAFVDKDDDTSSPPPPPPPSACFRNMPSRKCAEWRSKHLRVPAYVANDYAMRCSGGLSFHDRWPEHFVLGVASRPVQVERPSSCPYNMHQFLWIRTERDDNEEETKEGTITETVRVALMDSQQKTFLHGDFSTSFEGDFSDVNIFDPDFAKYPLLRRATISVTELQRGDVLFVPAGWLVAVHRLESDTKSGKVIVWRHCHVDASNLNLVESSLRVEALVSDDAKALHESIHRISGRTQTTVSSEPTSRVATSDGDTNETDAEDPAHVRAATERVACAERVGLEMWQCVASWLRNLDDVREIGHNGITAEERTTVLMRGKAGRTRFGHWQQLQSWRQLVRRHTVATPTALATNVGADFAVLRWYGDAGRQPCSDDPASGNNKKAVATKKDDRRDVVSGYYVVWKMIDATHADEHDATLFGEKSEEAQKMTGVLSMAFRERPLSGGAEKKPKRRTLFSATDAATGISVAHCSNDGFCFDTSARAGVDGDLPANHEREEDGDVTILLDRLSPGHVYHVWILPSLVKENLADRIERLNENDEGEEDDGTNVRATYESIGRSRLEPMLAVTVTTTASHTAFAPRSPMSIGVEPSAVRLRWFALPKERRGGLEIREYVVERRKLGDENDGGGESTATLSHWGGAVHFDGSKVEGWVKGLTPGQRYVFRIAAVNSRGVGEFSPASLATSTQQLSRTTSKHPSSKATPPKRLPSSSAGRDEGRVGSSVDATGVVDDHGSDSKSKSSASSGDDSHRGTLDTDEASSVSSAPLPRARVVSKHETRLPDHVVDAARTVRPALTPCFGPLVSLSDSAQRAKLHVSWKSVLSPADDEASETSLIGETQKKRLTESNSFEVWAAHYSPRAFAVTAEVVVTDPPKATTKIRNEAQVRDRMALIARGGAPLRTKVLNAQRAGAVAALIYDNTGRCDKRFDQKCSPGADKAASLGFAAQDTPESWAELSIPAVLIRGSDADKVLRLMDGKRV
eukprot:g3967.t1